MPRSLILGNGHLLAAFDSHLQLRDFYFPHVGMEDQTTYGHVHRLGVWVEGRGFAWMSDGSWKIRMQYEKETLVGECTATNDTLGIQLTVHDSVHPIHTILLRRFTVKSTDNQRKLVRLFFNHDFHIYSDKQKDTAFYEPSTNSIIHFREKRYFLIGGTTDKPTECFTGSRGGKFASVLRSRERLQTCGISSFTVGKSEYRGLEGTWRDAEDGELSRNAIEQGSVDSTVAIHCTVEADAPAKVDLWLCVAKNLEEVLELQQTVMRDTPDRLERNCRHYWKSWVNKTQPKFGALSPAIIDLYKRSLLMIRTHVDNGGGILAAADSDIMAFNRDTYTYVWPRDGAFISLALDRAGYAEVSRRFFEFCKKIQMPDGYFLHKYNPDGSPGSSWHPWFKNGEPQLPIQEDETALVIHALWDHFERNQDFEFLQSLFESFVEPAAQFMVDFREPETGLPLPSYDPWEEHRGIFSYTTATTIAGLRAAAHIAHTLGHDRHAELYRKTATLMHEALCTHLYDETHRRFLKKIQRSNGHTTERDATPDASLCMLWQLGILPADDPRIVSTMQQLDAALTVRTGIGGWARYPRDFYHCVTHPTPEVPGNPWIITTLWKAQWHIATARTLADLQPAKEILEWATARANSSGILPEQMHPHSGSPLSVSPLTWSHATFVDTVLKYLECEKHMVGQDMYRRMTT